MCFRLFKALICAFERVREPANKASRVRTKAEADLEICYESTHQCPQRKSVRNKHLNKQLSRFAIKRYIDKIHCWFLKVLFLCGFIGGFLWNWNLIGPRKSVNCQKYAAFPGSTQQRPFHAPLACGLGFGVYRGRVASLAFQWMSGSEVFLISILKRFYAPDMSFFKAAFTTTCVP